MKDERTIIAVGIIAAGAWYLLRPRAALVTPQLFPSFNATPRSPSPLGPGAGSTNPVTAILSGVNGALAAIFKLPGNATSRPATPTGTALPPTKYQTPPFQAPPFASPPLMAPMLPAIDGADYPVTVADPNYAGVPDWSWSLDPALEYIPPPPGTNADGTVANYSPVGGAPAGLTVGV